MRAIAFVDNSAGSDETSEDANKEILTTKWPLSDLIKAERRIARGSLRPYTAPGGSEKAFGEVQES